MSLTPEQRVRQNAAKWRIISMRELREGLKVGFISGGSDRKARVDLARTAYEAGFRDGWVLRMNEHQSDVAVKGRQE